MESDSEASENVDNNILSEALVKRFRKLYTEVFPFFGVWFHVIMPKRYVQQVTDVLAHYEYTFLPFSCRCKAEDEAGSHEHHIVGRERPQGRNTFSMACRQTFGTTGGRRRYYMKKIDNPCHLLATILYIQTCNTSGIHTGKRSKCTHTAHTFTEIVFNNNEEKREASDQLRAAIPEYNEAFIREARNYRQKTLNSKNKRMLKFWLVFRIARRQC